MAVWTCFQTSLETSLALIPNTNVLGLRLRPKAGPRPRPSWREGLFLCTGHCRCTVYAPRSIMCGQVYPGGCTRGGYTRPCT